MLTVIGLGPADAEGLSIAARKALTSAPLLYIRTERHPAVDDLRAQGVAYECFDALYESGDSFDAVYDAIVERVIASAQNQEVAYAVPGHPLVAEETVRRIIERARASNLPFRIVGSASFLEPALTALNLAVDNLLIIDALSLRQAPARADIGVLLHQVYSREVASDVKLELMREYPDEWEVTVVRQAGVQGLETITTIPLYRLDRIDVDHLTVVYVPPMPKDKRKKRFEDLVWVMQRLRDEDGCPWDREQDHKSLRKYMIEECYEALEAIDEDDLDGLCEELGDVMLQVVFHAQIEAEEGVFDAYDVIAAVVNKLIRRHPHVFGEVEVSGSDEVLVNWEQIKRSEKPEGWRESALDGVPAGMPALMRAMEISKRARKVGFEWEKFEDVLAKMDEEVNELREAIAEGTDEQIFGEIGDLLFTIVNVARWQKLDPEEALRDMLNRFGTRFRHMEKAASARGTTLDALSLAQMDELWNQAKRELGAD